jgi:long-chain acyl-CoA synthetase
VPDQPPDRLADAPRTVADLVRAAARTRPEHPAIVAGARTLTWGALDREVDAVVAGLVEAGLRPGTPDTPGDRVAVLFGNTPEFVATYFGVLRAGLVAVPLNPAYTAPELSTLLAEARARLVVRTEAATAVVLAASEGIEGLRITSYDGLVGGHVGAPLAAGQEPSIDPETLALLLFTSGTSGEPRGAMLTHRALLANVEQVAAAGTESVAADDVVLAVLPLSHVYSLNGTLAMAARAAATVVLVDRFETEGALRAIEELGVTNVPGAPPMFAAWSQSPNLAERMAGVRLMFTGAAPMPAAVAEQVMTLTGKPLYEGYGLTEAAPGVSSTLVGGAPKPGSVGKPFPGVEVRLLDESGDPVDEGDPGEISIRGANLFSGYWPDGSEGPDAEGWFNTGDVAYLDADGDLRLVDRRKELVIVSGFNVYPREIEDVLQLIPGVAEAAVVGVPHPYTGEAVKAFVVAKDGSGLTADDVVAFCQTRLARFKCPTIVAMVDALPHSAVGKVAKGRLREAAP